VRGLAGAVSDGEKWNPVEVHFLQTGLLPEGQVRQNMGGLVSAKA
jgi:hypothetical protein